MYSINSKHGGNLDECMTRSLPLLMVYFKIAAFLPFNINLKQLLCLNFMTLVSSRWARTYTDIAYTRAITGDGLCVPFKRLNSGMRVILLHRA